MNEEQLEEYIGRIEEIAAGEYEPEPEEEDDDE